MSFIRGSRGRFLVRRARRFVRGLIGGQRIYGDREIPLTQSRLRRPSASSGSRERRISFDRAELCIQLVRGFDPSLES